jgi:phosphoribosyl-AMP cyclohydrolase
MRTGRVCYWSRSRKARGARATRPVTSRPRSPQVDCDGDTLQAFTTSRASPAIPTPQLLLPRHGDGALETIAPVMIDMDKIGKDQGCRVGARTTSGLFGHDPNTPCRAATGWR